MPNIYVVNKFKYVCTIKKHEKKYIYHEDCIIYVPLNPTNSSSAVKQSMIVKIWKILCSPTVIIQCNLN